MTQLSLPRALAALLLLSVCVHAADPVISEFMALNRDTLKDQDGDASDWIEIHNPNPTAMNMDGWFLTDVVTNKTQWRFPAVTIPANGFLVVFASNKDRAIAGAELHTNFALGGGGEYLALIRPGGLTASTEFNVYPAQVEDVSYGTARAITTTTLLTRGSPVRALVPTDATLDTAWRARSFTDSGWSAGTLGVGYFTSAANPNRNGEVGLQVAMQNVNTTAYARVPFTVPAGGAVERVKLLVDYDDGFAAFIDGTHVASSPNAPSPATLAYNSRAGSSRNSGIVEEYDVSQVAGLLTAGTHVLAIHGLNQTLTSSDLFLLPELIMERSTGGSGGVGYFATASPGEANGGTDTLRLPQIVSFSRASGSFTAPISVTLTGAAAGQQIRYTVSDPSSAGATLPEPTAASTQYTGPITVSTSQIIRAAIFDPQTGRRGASKTAHYALLESSVVANTSNFSSNLPIVVVDTHGATPVDSSTNAYTSSLFHLVEPVNGIARLTTPPALVSRAGVRVRGSSSAGFPKKSLALEFWDEQNLDLDQPIAGFTDESDWILNGPWNFDDTFIHNAFIFEVSRRIGRWAPRTRFVEMFTNQNGGKLDYNDYSGVYVLTEKIKSNAGRLEITGIQPTDNTGEAVTGGYIFKIDRADSGEVFWKTNSGVPQDDWLVLAEPDPDFDTVSQIDYLKGYLNTFDATLLNERANGFTTRNYRNYIDTPAWIDHHILNTLAYNVDALRLSAFFHKDRNGKIEAGPIWDFDRALGSDDGRDSTPESWANLDYYFTRDWWGRLFQDPEFVQAWIDRWTQLREPGQPLQTASLTLIADQMGAQIGDVAGARDAARWPENAAVGGRYSNEIAGMKNWLTRRLTWLDSRMPSRPTVSLASGVVAPGSTVTLTGASAMWYTLNGADPRPLGGGPSTNSTNYTSPFAINETTVLTVRRRLGALQVFPGAISTTWSAPERRVYLVNESFAAPGDLAFSELNYHPLAPTPAEIALLPGVTAEDFEFIEIRNVSTQKVNLFESSFPEGMPFAALKLEPFSLAPGASAVVVRNRAAFTVRYGSVPASRIVGEWKEGSLSDGGEEIRLLARNGAVLLAFTYGDSGDWPGRADGKGATLEYEGFLLDEKALETPTNWRSSSELNGTPGETGAGLDERIVINEIFANSPAPRVDAIELFNTGGDAVDLSGWWLSDAGQPETIDSFRQYQIPAETVLQPGAYRVFTEADFNPNGLWNPNAGPRGAGEFALDAAHGDDVWLIASDATGAPDRVVDYQSFGATRLDESLGRFPNGTGNLAPMLARTLFNESQPTNPQPGSGALNAAPRVGPLLISEIQHSHPQSGAFEFIEIRNPTSTSQTLTEWRVRGAVDYDFAAGQSLAAGGLLVLVPFPPSEEAQANAFRAAYGIGPGVPLVGPWSPGDLLGPTGRVSLYRALPSPPEESSFVPRDTEDEVSYSSNGEWALATGGLSLNRRGSIFGRLASGWKADVPTPGFTGVSYLTWKNFFFPAGSLESGEDDDPDEDGVTNFGEYSWATMPLAFDPKGATSPEFGLTAGGLWTFSYERPLDRPGTRYQMQKSVDLEFWQPIADTVIATGADTETRQFTQPVSIDVPRLFFRVFPSPAP